MAVRVMGGMGTAPLRSRSSMKSALPISLCLALVLCGSAFAQSAPAEMISNYRLQHGEGRVTPDSTLSRIAREQAAAMASRDVLDHGVLGSFSSRVASSKSATTGRTYWAMVIATGERSPSRSPSTKPPASRQVEKTCRIEILGLCL
jgi:hypothetical protein